MDVQSPEEAVDICSGTAALFAVSQPRDSPIILNPTVNEVKLKMELDTGITVSLASEQTWKMVFKNCPLDECQTPENVHWTEATSVGTDECHSGV